MSANAWDRFARMMFYVGVAISLTVIILLQFEHAANAEPSSGGSVAIMLAFAAVAFLISIGTLSVLVFQQGAFPDDQSEVGS